MLTTRKMREIKKRIAFKGFAAFQNKEVVLVVDLA
jgi:hypothetical protein